MIERKDGTYVGDLCFKGINSSGITEIGYGMAEEHQGHGYAMEAVKTVVAWALQNPNVIAVEAETEPENAVSQRVLEKCGFIAYGMIGEEGPRFTVS